MTEEERLQGIVDRLLKADADARARWARVEKTLRMDYRPVGGKEDDCDGFLFPDAYSAGDHLVSIIVGLREEIRRLESQKSCPCEFGKPCGPNCTCGNGHLSGGCRRCCKYGDQDQQSKNAARIIANERHSPTRGTEPWRKVKRGDEE